MYNTDMANRTLGKLFTEWGLLGYDIKLTLIYSDVARIENGSNYDGGSVLHAYVVDPNGPVFSDIAHILFRTDSDGNATKLLNADIYFYDNTAFVKGANLETLNEIFNKKEKQHA